MAKLFPILIICICAAAICMIGVILITSSSTPFYSGTEPAYTQLPAIPEPTKPSSSNPTSYPTETPTATPAISATPTPAPTASIPSTPTPIPMASIPSTPKPSSTPTSIPTSEKTASPTPVPTLSALQIEGISLLAGKWYGEQSIPLIVKGVFHADCKDDFTAVMDGTVTFGTSENDFFLPVTWQYLGNTRFIAKTGDGTEIPFTCDGKKMTLSINPKKDIADTYPDANLQIELFKV